MLQCGCGVPSVVGVEAPGSVHVHHGRGHVAHRHEQLCVVERLQFYVRQIVNAELTHVNLPLSRVGHGQSVVAHGRVSGSQSAHAHRFKSAGSAVVAQVDARHAPQRVGGACDATSHDVGRVDALHGNGSGQSGHAPLGGDFGSAQRVRLRQGETCGYNKGYQCLMCVVCWVMCCSQPLLGSLVVRHRQVCLPGPAAGILAYPPAAPPSHFGRVDTKQWPHWSAGTKGIQQRDCTGFTPVSLIRRTYCVQK